MGEARAVVVLAAVETAGGRQRGAGGRQVERERLRRAEELARAGHWELDLRAGTVALSDGARHLFDCQCPARLPLGDLLDRFRPADRERVLAALAADPDPGVREWEGELVDAAGGRRRILMRGARTCDGAGREVIAGVMLEISDPRAGDAARAETEALFEQGFDRSPIGMAVTEPHTGRYLRVNDALCRLLGRSRAELLGLRFTDVSHPEDVAVAQAELHDMALGKTAELDYEKRYLRPDGSVVWVALHVMPIYGAGRAVRAVVSQVVDLTSHKERERQLVQDAADFERLAEIRAALAEDRLVLHAQPIMDLRTGELVQQELLVRLRGRDGRLVSPGAFLPAAERHGAIVEIDRWVIGQAVAMAAGGQPVQVNLSAASVGDRGMLSVIREAIEQTGADPALLVFEVTETALMADLEGGRRLGATLRALGCRFALDDFGTGYGTFTYLKHIPIDYLKIDVDFVRDLRHSPDDQRLVRAIVTMAQDLGKKTTAEGVEDAATLELLRELGVDHAQGYHIGRPAEIHNTYPAARERPAAEVGRARH